MHVQGLADGAVVDEWTEVTSIGRGVDANLDWPAVERLFVNEARWLSPTPAIAATSSTPRPARRAAAALVPRQADEAPAARLAAGRPPLTLLPCELIVGNGDKLQRMVLGVAEGWGLADPFARWIGEDCLWVNSLVDRIVSEPLEPAGAVAEPYALWAVERQPRLVMPCAIRRSSLTDDLARYERLKLFILNLGHTWLAEGWAARGVRQTPTVRNCFGRA